MTTISQFVEQYTASISNFQTKRNYVSMSHAVENADTLLNQYYNGFADSLDIRLRCYKGYQWERDLMERLAKTFPQSVYYDPKQEIELTAFDGLVKGHLEASFDDYPLDGKTVPLDEHLPKDGKVSRRIYWQLNAYMLYSHKEKALAVFESRESGHLRDFWIRENKSIQSAINDKFTLVTSAIKDIDAGKISLADALLKISLKSVQA